MQLQFLEDVISGSKDLLAIPEAARDIHKNIVKILSQLERSGCSSCLDSEFKVNYFKILELFEAYQNAVVANSSYNISCKVGCSQCCFHWVEDVNSFEAQIISEYVKKHYPERIDNIISQCSEDIEVLGRIEELTIEKVKNFSDSMDVDHIDIALSAFYQMKRMCPLLSEKGVCTVYKVRPLTCRMYLSFHNPSFCNPDYQSQEVVSNYLLNLDEDANSILDRLHFRYQIFPDDSGLRSLLFKYLQKCAP